MNATRKTVLDQRPMMEISEYKSSYMPGRRPSINTMKKWVDDGVVDGTKIGTTYFIYTDVDPDIKVNPDDDPVVNAFFDMTVARLGK